jgi:GT2 family glycosyltransferase
MICVIITSKNRPQKLTSCINALLRNTAKDFKIILIDQSTDNKTLRVINTTFRNNKKITYVRENPVGKSKALNRGLDLSESNVLAFTDDDCIVSRDWISQIKLSFESNSIISCVTGDTRPFMDIPIWACPPIFSKKLTIYSKPQYHGNIGFGNNYAIRKSDLKSIGLFKTWLGPGSITTNCEDGEIIIRFLTQGYAILHNPKMVVYHNKNLNKTALKKQNLSYICGEMACYGYYSFSGYSFAQKIVKNNLTDSFSDIKRIFGDILKRKIIKPQEWEDSIKKLVVKTKGILIGLFFYIKEV